MTVDFRLKASVPVCVCDFPAHISKDILYMLSEQEKGGISLSPHTVHTYHTSKKRKKLTSQRFSSQTINFHSQADIPRIKGRYNYYYAP